MFITQDSAYNNDSLRSCYMYMDDICVMDASGNTSDTNICVPAFPAAITGNYQGTYLWSTGETTATITVSSPGAYWRVVRDECLYHTDTIRVAGQPIARLGKDTVLCQGDSIQLGTQLPGMAYSWNNNDTTCCITIHSGGQYILTATNNCGSATDSILVTEQACQNCFEIPTAFSPNNDGLNDKFRPKVICPVKEFHLRIYNRWGQLVFSTNNPTDYWDGTLSGTPQDVGVYFYYLDVLPLNWNNNKKISQKGDITLVK